MLLPVICPGLAVAQMGPPGFSGVWGPEDWSGWSVDQPFTPEGQALQDAWGPEHDTGLQCIYPLGRILSGMWLIEIYQTEGRVLVLYEHDNKVRRIYTDGRGHIDTFPSLMGRSTTRLTIPITIANRGRYRRSTCAAITKSGIPSARSEIPRQGDWSNGCTPLV